MLPHDYQTSCLPSRSSRLNNHREPARVSLMFTWQNAPGSTTMPLGATRARSWQRTCCAVLHHAHRQRVSGEGGRVVSDPLAFAIAAEGGRTSYHSRFDCGGDGAELWAPFEAEGRLGITEDAAPSRPGERIGAAVCVELIIPPGEEREARFALAWDMPLARFGDGAAYTRRYKRFYPGAELDGVPVAAVLARDALNAHREWIEAITAWQKPVLEALTRHTRDPHTPRCHPHTPRPCAGSGTSGVVQIGAVQRALLHHRRRHHLDRKGVPHHPFPFPLPSPLLLSKDPVETVQQVHERLFSDLLQGGTSGGVRDTLLPRAPPLQGALPRLLKCHRPMRRSM